MCFWCSKEPVISCVKLYNMFVAFIGIFIQIFMKLSIVKNSEIGNDIHHFGKFLFLFELGRGQYSLIGPKSN